MQNPSQKYRPFQHAPKLPDRQWPSRTLTHAPRWCSVDLRDGNQALAVPMNVSQKLELFQTLVKIGFKEIEVGFPSASNTEFAFKPSAHRERPFARRRVVAGARASARGFDRAHCRIFDWRKESYHPFV
ncbi:MAG: hypothetical protein WDM76_09300 [Limisphaerales bacterium]